MKGRFLRKGIYVEVLSNFFYLIKDSLSLVISVIFHKYQYDTCYDESSEKFVSF